MRRIAASLLALVVSAAHALPGYESVRAAHQRSDARLFDRHGELLQEMRVDNTVRRLEWVELRDISPALIQAVLRAEDRRFYTHDGVDWRALGTAALRGIFNRNPRGASTITMQLAAWLDPRVKAPTARRTLREKWAQIDAAREIEAQWTKAQILESYLNLVYFRGELQGIAAAARGLFDKTPSGLDAAESAILAALLRAPGASGVLIAKRACVLNSQLAWQTDCSAISTLAQRITHHEYRIQAAADDAPHIARHLLNDRNRQAQSTLNGGLQRYARASLAHHLSQLRTEDVRDGAVLAVDNKTGEVLAYVGNSGRGYVDGVRALRQGGSTLKPFLYALALERRVLTAASVLDDSPVNVVSQGGVYNPQNYDHEFKGWVSVRTALASSLNVPAVRTLMLLGSDAFLQRLRAMGFDNLDEDGDYYGYALALGGADVTLWQLVHAYRGLSNRGIVSPLRIQADGPSASRRVIDAGAAFVIADILADRGARGVTFGLDSVLATTYWSAVKTGTSKDMRDNWCIGFSDRYTVGVWVGNFDGQPMHNVSGITGAAPVWLEVMNYLHRQNPAHAPKPEKDIETRNVHFTPALEADRVEYFLSGTAMSAVDIPIRPSELVARITYPGNGMLMATDPDIPLGNQRVYVEINTQGAGYSIQIDDGPRHALEYGWQPIPGPHQVTLYGEDGQVLDQTRFIVRGAAL